MKVPLQQGNKPEQEVELFITGNSFGVQTGNNGPLLRIGPLTPSQWALVRRAAEDRSGA